jgi:hypothetical protein
MVVLLLAAILITLLHAWNIVFAAILVLAVIGIGFWVLSLPFQLVAAVMEWRALPATVKAERWAAVAKERRQAIRALKITAWVIGSIVALDLFLFLANWVTGGTFAPDVMGGINVPRR